MKIKKRKLFEAVEDMGSDSTAGMGEELDMSNLDGTDMGEVFRTLNKLDKLEEQRLNEASLSKLHRYIDNNHVAFISAFLSRDKLEKYYSELIKEYQSKEVSNVSRRINRLNNKELKDQLLGLSYNVIKVLGWYEYEEFEDKDGTVYPPMTSKEESYIVLSKPNQTYKDFVKGMVSVADKFHQESVLIIEQKGISRTLHFTDGRDKKMGRIKWGANAPFQTLIDGRPFVVIGESFENVDRLRGYEVIAYRMAAKSSKGALTVEDFKYILEGSPNFAWRDKKNKESGMLSEAIDNTYDALRALDKLDD